jgi:Fungal specific transcription factor domain
MFDLSQYDRFWQDPYASPIIWVGLLFTIMCLGADPQQYSMVPLTDTPPSLDSDPSTLINIFRERIVQCLMLGKYTNGRPYVLETLIQYFMIEHFLREDAEFEIWIMLHMLIPIALRMGLHRDPKYFSGISTFAGEMQRRLWATIFQIDIGYSALAGLPRMIKPQQCDTEEPRNLQDFDFDEETTDLPPSRPESEVTPVLWVLAKQRLIPVGGIISDLAHDTRPYPYTELIRIETLLRKSRESLPSSMKWQPLPQSDTHDPQVIMQRVYLELFFHKMLITLYKKYLSISVTNSQYDHARDTCLESAIRILEYQHLLDTTQFGYQVSSAHWRMSSLLNHDFLLAASILCFYLRLDIGNRDVNSQTEIIRSLLRQSHDIWLQSSSNSKEAQKAVRSLSIILGIEHGECGEHGGNEVADYLVQLDDTGTWPHYQGRC